MAMPSIDTIWTIHGKVGLPPAARRDAVIAELRAELDKQHIAYRHDAATGQISWSQPWGKLVRTNWDWFASVNAAQIDVGTGPDAAIVYRLGLLHSLALCLFAAFCAGGAVASDHGLVRGALTAGIALPWLFGVNLVVVALHARRIFRKIVGVA